LFQSDAAEIGFHTKAGFGKSGNTRSDIFGTQEKKVFAKQYK
jgi:hypothetical protein